jgi:hypothetical protein
MTGISFLELNPSWFNLSDGKVFGLLEYEDLNFLHVKYLFYVYNGKTHVYRYDGTKFVKLFETTEDPLIMMYDTQILDQKAIQEIAEILKKSVQEGGQILFNAGEIRVYRRKEGDIMESYITVYLKEDWTTVFREGTVLKTYKNMFKGSPAGVALAIMELVYS